MQFVCLCHTKCTSEYIRQQRLIGCTARGKYNIYYENYLENEYTSMQFNGCQIK